MKLLFGLVITVLTVVVLAQRPSTTTAFEPMNWSTIAPVNDNSALPVATKKDLLVYWDSSAPGPEIDPNIEKRGTSNIDVMSIRRRNAEGVYVPVGNITTETSAGASTNGKWIALQSMMGTTLFRVDNNNTISEASYILTYGGYLFSDDTFAGYIYGNNMIRTYQYEESENDWIEIPGTELIVNTGVQVQGDWASYRASDTHLVILDTSNTSNIHVQIYSRQANKSWEFLESVPVNGSYYMAEEYASINYNDVDTLVLSTTQYSSFSGSGFVFVYTKINGQWTEQTFTTSSVGYRSYGNLGRATLFVDADTLFVSAGLEGYDVTNPNQDLDNVGKVLVMTRNSNGTWEPSLDLNNPVGAGIWGSAIGVNDYDIIVPNVDTNNGYTLTFFTAPRCLAQPINATCNDLQVNDCSQVDVTKVDLSSLYTINNAPCGQFSAINATLEGASLINKVLQAQFSFSRNFGQSVTCNATVTCPAAPTVPIAQTPSNNVSSANALGVGFGIVGVFLMMYL